MRLTRLSAFFFTFVTRSPVGRTLIMYDSALPSPTLNTLFSLGPADIVVGIPSYRNSETIEFVTATAAAALEAQFPDSRCLIVNVDGLAFDDTLNLAQTVPMPSNVTQVATRYVGLPGKGSAVRAILETATVVQARAVILLEADNRSLTPAWIAALAEPILNRGSNFVVPHFGSVSPAALTNDLVAYPLLYGLYQSELRYPLAGDVAMAGSVAAYFADRDVWETEVARDGIDGWMVLQMIVDGGQIAQVPLPHKAHVAANSSIAPDQKFIQELAPFFRSGLLHEAAWRDAERTLHPVRSMGAPPVATAGSPPDSALLLREAGRALALPDPLLEQVLHPRTYSVLEELLHDPESFRLDAQWWAYMVYDFFVLHNLGEGDPDKILGALYPLLLLRAGALSAQANGSLARWNALVEEQAQAFRELCPYLQHRWDSYTPPES